MTIQEKIERKRKQLNLTYYEVAKRSNFEQGNAKKTLLGLRGCKFDTMVLFAKSVGLVIDAYDPATHKIVKKDEK